MLRFLGRYSCHNNSMTAIVTAESAILNAGQKWKSIKSTTAPYNRRSSRLPKAPPRISPSMGCISCENVLYFNTRKTLTAAAKKMKNHDAFFNKPKAVPVFKTCVNETIVKSIDEFS